MEQLDNLSTKQLRPHDDLGNFDLHIRSVLDELVLERNITVFAMEYNYSSELAFLENYYRINYTPSLVANYNHSLSGFAPKGVIEGFLWSNRT